MMIVQHLNTFWDPCRIHAAFPPPAGSHWKIFLRNQVLADMTLTFVEDAHATCVAIAPAQSEKAKIVKDVNEAVKHINQFGTMHTDAIITADKKTANFFFKKHKKFNWYS